MGFERIVKGLCHITNLSYITFARDLHGWAYSIASPEGFGPGEAKNLFFDGAENMAPAWGIAELTP